MTYYILLGLALVVAGSGAALRKRSTFWGQALILGGVVGCLACLAWQIRESMFPPGPREPDRGQAVVGYFLANQLLGEVSGVQGTVVLCFPPSSILDEETVGTYAGTFKRVLRGFPGLDIQVVALEVPDKDARAGRFPLTAFQRAASKLPPALACVSFAGVPPDIKSFQSSPGISTPPFFVFDPWGTTNWLGALRSGVVRCVIVPRPGLRHGANQEISGEPNAVFTQLYLMATSANADQVVAQLGGK